MDNSNNSGKNNFLPWIIVLVLVLVIGVLSYYFLVYLKKPVLPSVNDTAKVSNNIENKNKTESVADVSNTKSSCDGTFSSSEKEFMKNWKTFSSGKYKYSFQYPNTWEPQGTDEDNVTFVDNSDKLTFYLKAAEMTALGLEGYKVESEKSIKIDCADSNQINMSGDPAAMEGGAPESSRIIFAKFTKNGTDFLPMMFYEYIGASVSGDIVEAWDLILKSVKFN